METETEVAPGAVKLAPVELPCGVIGADGAVHRVVTLSRMTGKDRRDIAEQEVARNGGRILTKLLVNRVESIEGLDLSNPKEKETICRKMASADRSFLLLKLRQVSIGDECTVDFSCPRCKFNSQAEFDLRTLIAKPMDRKFFQLPQAAGWAAKFETAAGEAIMRLANGEDEELISPIFLANQVEAQQKLILRCLVEYKGQRAFTQQFIDSLGIEELDDLTELWNELQPGADMSILSQCASCGSQVSAMIGVYDFLVSRRRSRRL